MSERPLIEDAMKRLAEQKSAKAASDSVHSGTADPRPAGAVTGRQGIGRRSYDEALAWRRAQLAAAMGEKPAVLRSLPPRAPRKRAEAPVLGRRPHENLALVGHPEAPALLARGGFTRAELIGTGLVCAVASAALTWALVLAQSPGPLTKRSDSGLSAVRPVPLPLAARAAGKPSAAVAVAAAPAPDAASVPSTAAPLQEAPIAAPVVVNPAPVATVRVAETTVPGPVPPVAGFEEAAVRSVLEAWRAAWVAVDIERYLALYASDFVSAEGADRAAWAESRRKNFARKAGIEVDIRQVALDRLAEDRFAVHFIQDYRAGSYRERGTKKTLVMTRQAEGWRISEERQER